MSDHRDTLNTIYKRIFNSMRITDLPKENKMFKVIGVDTAMIPRVRINMNGTEISMELTEHEMEKVLKVVNDSIRLSLLERLTGDKQTKAAPTSELSNEPLYQSPGFNRVGS